MKKFSIWINLLLLSSIFLVPNSKAGEQLGVNIGDTFQLTFEFTGRFRDSYIFPYTNFLISNQDLPFVVEYQVGYIQPGLDNESFVQFVVRSDTLNQHYDDITSPLNLVDSFDLSYNSSYFQPPAVMSLDFVEQFERLFTNMNDVMKYDNHSLLLDFEYSYDNNNFAFSFATNHSDTFDGRIFQESIVAYNLYTGILEYYHSTIIYEDGSQGWVDEISIINTSESALQTGNPEKVVDYISVFIVVLIVLIIIGYIGWNIKIRSGKLKRQGSQIVKSTSTHADVHPDTQSTNHYEDILSQRSNSIAQPKVVQRILCPTCNTVNLLDSNYCLECGIYIGD